jgi:hypothetical protein
MRPQPVDIEKPVDLAQQVIRGNRILQRKRVKQLLRAAVQTTHHRSAPGSFPSPRVNQNKPRAAQTSSTLSAEGHPSLASQKRSIV